MSDRPPRFPAAVRHAREILRPRTPPTSTSITSRTLTDSRGVGGLVCPDDMVTIEKWYTLCGAQHPAQGTPDCDVEVRALYRVPGGCSASTSISNNSALGTQAKFYETFNRIHAINPDTVNIIYLNSMFDFAAVRAHALCCWHTVTHHSPLSLPTRSFSPFTLHPGRGAQSTLLTRHAVAVRAAREDDGTRGRPRHPRTTPCQSANTLSRFPIGTPVDILTADCQAAGKPAFLRDVNGHVVILCNDGNFYCSESICSQ